MGVAKEVLDIILRGKDEASKEFKKSGDALLAVGKIAGSVAAAGLAVAGAATAALGVGLKIAMDEAMEAQENMAQLNAVLQSTGGAAGITAQEADALATSLSGVTRYSNDAILSAETLLLGFTNIKENVFPQVTQLALDLSTRLGVDLDTAVRTLGKSLDMPAEGMTNLTRLGVRFTEEQQKVIQSMVDTGNAAGAQKYIIDALTKSYGGAAEAAGKTLAGQWDILKNKALNVAEAVGTALIPVGQQLLDSMLPALDELGKQITEFINSEKFQAWVTEVTRWLRDDFPAAMQKVIDFLSGDFARALYDGAIAVGKLVTMMAEAAQAADILVNWNDKIRAALDQNSAKLIETADGYQAYADGLRASAEAAGYMIDAQGALTKGFEVSKDGWSYIPKVIQDHYLLSEAEWEAARAATEMGKATNTLGSELGTLSTRATATATAIEEVTGTVEGFSLETLRWYRAKAEAEAKAAKDEAEALQRKKQETQAALYAARAAVYESEMNRVLAASMSGTLANAARTYQTTIAGLTGTVEENALAQYNALEAMRATTKAQIYSQASQGLSADAALDLANKMGMISQEDYIVASSIMQLRAAYDQNRDGAISAAEGVDQYSEAVRNLYAILSAAQEKGLPIVAGMFGNLAGGMAGEAGGLPAAGTPFQPGPGTVQNNQVYNATINAGLVLSFADEVGLREKLGPMVRWVVRNMPAGDIPQ